MPNSNELELIKAGAFSVYAEAGVPQDQWESKLASHIQAINQFQRSTAVIPLVKQALAEKQAAAAKTAKE
jgi:hypothetical protein